MNAANFVHPGYLMRIKAAVLRAVAKARRPGQPRATALETVYNRREKPSLLIIARAGRGFEVFGGPDMDDDVTPLVVAALRRHHAAQPPRIAVDVQRGSLGRGVAWGLALSALLWAGIIGGIAQAVAATPAPTYLWLVLCLDGAACTDAQVYQIDRFEGLAAVFDCDGQADARAAEMQTAGLLNWRIGCKTVADFDKEGI